MWVKNLFWKHIKKIYELGAANPRLGNDMTANDQGFATSTSGWPKKKSIRFDNKFLGSKKIILVRHKKLSSYFLVTLYFSSKSARGGGSNGLRRIPGDPSCGKRPTMAKKLTPLSWIWLPCDLRKWKNGLKKNRFKKNSRSK